jgi:hypothetical protein
MKNYLELLLAAVLAVVVIISLPFLLIGEVPTLVEI